MKKAIFRLFTIILFIQFLGCTENSKPSQIPSKVIPFFQHWNLILGDGSNVGKAIDYQNKDFFYVTGHADEKWVVFKTPNAGNTHGTSNNTRTELAQLKKWSPLTDAKLDATLKVMSVASTGDARVAATYSVVVGQIHSADGHQNEPLKIFYKKFPGHTKGSVFWNYEINTDGEDNSGRWDFSTAVWGHNMAVIGTAKDDYPSEPEEGIKLGEEFSYEVNVYQGIMYLTFTSPNHKKKSYIKNLISSEYVNKSDLPEQVKKLFVPIGQDGTERASAYSGELNYFKQGAYNQANGKNPEKNMVWFTGSDIYGGDIAKQYKNGSYTEVWYREATVGPGTPPK